MSAIPDTNITNEIYESSTVSSSSTSTTFGTVGFSSTSTDDRIAIGIYSGFDTATTASSNYAWIPRGSYYFLECSKGNDDDDRLNARLDMITSGTLNELRTGGLRTNGVDLAVGPGRVQLPRAQR